MTQPLVWFVTGCSSGFGASLARLALRNGHHVIATSRNPSKTPDIVSQVKELGGTWLALDICSSELPSVVKTATQIYGKIDVLVNNAGYCLLGAFETFTEQEGRDQMETNFFGPMNLIRLVLSAMRERGSGTIINMSSTAGIEAKPSRTLYSGSKFALEGFSEALHAEVKPLGVRVLLVEPGAFHTSFPGNLVLGSKGVPRQYEGTITQQVLQAVKDFAAGTVKLPGDVEKGVQAIWDVVMKTGQAEGMEEFVRLPLGKDGSGRWEAKLAELKKNLDGTEKIWANTDRDI